MFPFIYPMAPKHSTWLIDELPTLVREGVIDHASAERISKYYAKTGAGDRTWASMIFGLLGGLLVGLGIILLLAHNWDEFSRSTRTVFAGIPLLAAQAMAWVVLFRKSMNHPRAEGVAIFWSLSVAAVIAMVSQIYHMPGHAGDFVLTWMLLSLPIIYLMNALGVSLVYLAGITHWAGNAAIPGLDDATAIWFWPLWLAVAPFAVTVFRARPSSARTAWLMWGLTLSASAGLIITMMDLLDAWWLPVAGVYSAILYLFDKRFFSGARSWWQRPGYVTGVAGAVVIAFWCTFDVSTLDWLFYSRFLDPLPLAMKLQLGLAAILLLVFARFLGWTLRARAWSNLWVGAIPLLIMGRQAWLAADAPEFVVILVFNMFLLAMGLAKLVEGFKTQQAGRANAGLLMVFALIAARFFDADIDFILKGILFVLLGAAFLMANIMLTRRRKGAA